MDDAKRLVRELRDLARKLQHRDPHDGNIALINEAAAEVERLTPKPMTLEEACDVLNAKRHRGIGTWKRDRAEGGFLSDSMGPAFLHAIDAIHIAQDLMREKEAARA